MLLVLVSVVVVMLAATLTPHRELRAGPESEDPRATSSLGILTRAQRAVRAAVVLVLVAALLAGRLGVDDELDNLAPALVVGAGWPLLVVGCLLIGGLWRWIDPWDSIARVVVRGDRSGPAGHVFPACVVALGCLWFLHVYPRPLDPRAVGTALAVYTVVAVAGCVAVGRARWLSCGEPVGLLLTWVGLVPRRRLARWHPPRGAALLLGMVVAGTVFGAVRRTELWTDVAVLPAADLYASAALLLACLAGGALAVLAQRLSGGPDRGAAVAQALVPVAAGVILAVALARNRFFISVQLLPGLAGDPLGRGWDLLGAPTDNVVAAPLTDAGLVALQLGVVALAHLFAALTAPRRLVGDERLPVILTLAVSVGVVVTALAWH